MQFYAVLNGDTLEFQKRKPDVSEYAEYSEESVDFPDEGGPPWYKYWQKTKNIRFLDKISPINTGCWFNGFEYLEHFDKTNLDTSQTKNLYYMFSWCKNLREIDLSGLDISYVENLSGMFNGCERLTDIYFDGWETSNVQNFSAMFSFCEHLSSLDISSFSMESVEDISFMFRGCVNLKHIQLPRMANNKVLARSTFMECISLRDIDLSNFCFPDNNFSKGLLKGCHSLSLSSIRMTEEQLKNSQWLSKI